MLMIIQRHVFYFNVPHTTRFLFGFAPPLPALLKSSLSDSSNDEKKKLTEIVDNVERLANFLRSLSLDHVGHRFARNVQQILNVQVIGSQNQLKQRRLINFAKLEVPSANIIGSLILVRVILLGFHRRILNVILAVFGNLPCFCLISLLFISLKKKKKVYPKSCP